MIDIPNRVDNQRPFLFRLGVELFCQLFETRIAFGPRLSDRMLISHRKGNDHGEQRQQFFLYHVTSLYLEFAGKIRVV